MGGDKGINMSDETEAVETRRHWSTKARLILAGVAVLGVGAAITTAAWTDNVFFEADASAAGSVDLQGCIGATVTLPDCSGADNVGWDDSEVGTPGSIVLSYAGFDPFLQGDTQGFQIAVQNSGTGTVELTADPFLIETDTTNSAPTATDALCGTEADWTVTFAVPPELGPGSPTPTQTAPIVVTVTSPADWDDACTDWVGWVVLRVQGDVIVP